MYGLRSTLALTPPLRAARRVRQARHATHRSDRGPHLRHSVSPRPSEQEGRDETTAAASSLGSAQSIRTPMALEPPATVPHPPLGTSLLLTISPRSAPALSLRSPL